MPKKITAKKVSSAKTKALPQKSKGPKFSTTANGLQYALIIDKPGTNTPKLGDQIEMHISTSVGDSVIYDSRKLNDNKPVPFTLQAASFKGDLTEGFMLMTPGDSGVFKVSVDSLKKNGAPQIPFAKDGDMVIYKVNMVSVKSQQLLEKERAENAAKRGTQDAKDLASYFAKNNIQNPQKTASGLHYVVTKPGAGEKPKVGQNVTVNYTGKTLNGNVFDSNVDPKFGHVQPFSFALGKGQVIRGWDEGIALIEKGAKATLFIPSTLAYGERGQGQDIPPNSILIFDVEVVDFKDGQ
jgi:FKBP-type peptidyl-prolyl cis-trans isomerase